MTEDNLVQKIKKGDEAAFKQFVFKYQDLVINICYRFLRNPEDAEEIAQDVFIEVYKSVQSFRNEAAVSTWLYRIATNKSLNHLKKFKKKKKLEKYIDAGIRTIHSGSNPHVDMEKAERQKLLFEVINALPENQKKAFILSKYENLSYKEIADVMAVSLSSVESLLFRAKKNLQKKLTYHYKKNGF